MTVPVVKLVSANADGTAVIMFPSGIVAVAEIVADWIRQLLTLMLSGAPTLSVSVMVTGDERSHGAP